MFRVFTVLFFSTAVGLLHAQTVQPLKPAGTIRLPNVKGRIDHMAADLDGKRLFVAALGNNTVEVLDATKRMRLQTLSGLAEPQGLGYVPGFNRLFIANGADGTVRVYDGKTLQLLQTTRLGDDADNVRVGVSKDRVFVGYGKGALAAMNNAGKKLSAVKLDAHPESFQLETLGPRIFVNVPDAKEIEVVDREKQSVIARWQTGKNRRNFPMAMDEADKRLFVVCRLPATLLVLNMDTGAIVAKLPVVGDSDDVFYDRVRKRIYATGGAGAISVYSQKDPDHYRQIANIPTASGARTSLFVADWNRLFVAAPARGSRTAEIRIFETQQ